LSNVDEVIHLGVGSTASWIRRPILETTRLAAIRACIPAFDGFYFDSFANDSIVEQSKEIFVYVGVVTRQKNDQIACGGAQELDFASLRIARERS
jgi:hypothetical protein